MKISFIGVRTHQKKSLYFSFVGYIFILGCSCLFSQEHSKVDILATLLREDKLEEIAERLPQVAERFPNSATVLYLQGILEKDAPRAVSYFLKLLDLHKDSQFADRAALRIAQYHFARGNYITAKKYYRTIINTYPESRLCDHAAYHEAQCYLAQGKTDSAQISLYRFIHDFQSSPLIGAAIMDLDALEKEVYDTSFPGIESIRPNQKSKKYTVQIGAFQRKENAVDLVKKAMEMGYDVEGFRKGKGTERVYVVWIGSFQTRDEAEEFAHEFQKKHNMEYIIVPKPD